MRKEEEQIVRDFKEVFDGDNGKRVLGRLSKMCHEHKGTYVDQNPTGSAYREGQRSVILHIRAMLNKDLKESKQKEAKNARELRQDRTYYRCSVSGLAGFASRPSIAPGRRDLMQGGRALNQKDAETRSLREHRPPDALWYSGLQDDPVGSIMPKTSQPIKIH